ncbi:MAG: T9SS type A sorting domain-containing protein [Candidatus Mcinerneyibacterium aminivorans]|uniref:T9SS type A sorting domain-containing protein n=1 Tax=Candidatus Mcinerneyibacterium aminivorans TaxID=2703815 RepID=A0A5D0MLA9_9BACT|nr:MAG: T9SS type A sorting domain-containing protein [Candidatus Mcinerneyibacterium aminivorans]
MKKFLLLIGVLIFGISVLFAIPDTMTLNLSVLNNSETSDNGAYLYHFSTNKEVQLSLEVSGVPSEVQEYDDTNTAQPVPDYNYCVVLVIEKGFYKRIKELENANIFYFNDGIHNLSPTYMYYNEPGWNIESNYITAEVTHSTNNSGGIGGITSSIPHYFFYNEDNGNLDFGRYRVYAEVRKYKLNENGEAVISELSEKDAVFDDNGDYICTMQERVSNIEFLDYGWIEYPFNIGNTLEGDYWAINADALSADPSSMIKYTSNSEDASTANFSFKWKKPTGASDGSSDVEFTLEYAYQEGGDYQPLKKSDGTLVSMADFQYDSATGTWSFPTTLEEIFGDYYGLMFFRIMAHDPGWPNEAGMDEDGDGTAEEWDGYYESLNEIVIDYHKLGYSVLQPENRSVPYYQGELIKFRWAAPAFEATYALQYKMVADSQGNAVTDSEWMTHQEFNNDTYSYDATPEEIFSGFGTYEIRIKGERTSNGEVYYSDNTVEIEYQSINSVIKDFVIQDSYSSAGEQRHTDFIMQNSYGSTSPCPLYINWIENQTVLNYYYTIQKASDPSPSDSDFQEITGSINDGSLSGEKYYDFNVSTIDTITGPGVYSYYFKFVTEGGHEHVIKKNFNVHKFMWKVIPSFDESYFQVFALGEGLTDPEKSLSLLVLSDSQGNSWKLTPKGTGLYVSPDSFNTRIYDNTVNFILECTMRKTNTDYYVQVGPSVQYNVIQINSEAYTITRGLELNTHDNNIKMAYMNVNFPEYHGIDAIDGKIYYISSNRYSHIDINRKNGYKTYKWENGTWTEVNSIEGSGYYSVAGNSTVPKVEKTALKGNYPNPFNPSTTIKFDIEEPGNVNLYIYDTKGKIVKKLIKNKYFSTGSNYQIEWHGKNRRGNQVASGVYYYVLSVNGTRDVKKMVLLK